MKKVVLVLTVIACVFLTSCTNPTISDLETDQPTETHQLQDPANILKDGEELLYSFYDLMSYPKEQELGYDGWYKSLEEVEQEQLANKKIFCAKVKMTDPYYRFTLISRIPRWYSTFQYRGSYEIIELYYQDPVLNLSNGDIFESHSECQSTQIKKGVFVPRFVCNSVWMEYGKEYLLLGYINEEGTDSTPPVATLPWIFEWDISREEEAEERQQYGLLPRNEDKFVIRDQIMEKYVN